LCQAVSWAYSTDGRYSGVVTHLKANDFLLRIHDALGMREHAPLFGLADVAPWNE
jgi:hypothetical protein